MIRLFCILFFIFSFNFVSAEVKDTCKTPVIKFDTKPQIINLFFNCLVDKDFWKLSNYCSGSVDFITVFNGSERIEGGTDLKAIDNLENLIKKFEYSSFNIVGGKTQIGENVIVAKLYPFEDVKDYYLNIVLVLNYKNEINKIVLF